MSPTLDAPTAMAFTPDGRIFVAQKDGVVRVVADGKLLDDPFIDLSSEVGNAGDRGMLGIAIDPNFATNRYVYLLYTVDPIPGHPDEVAFEPTFGRLTRYTGTSASNGAVANPASRTVLLGATPSTGSPVCWTTHTIGGLRWGLDGSLLVSTGDGARFEDVDAGGQTPGCLAFMTAAEDVGAFRSQMLDSLAGKVLRLNPATGHGYASNPYYNGNVQSIRSKVWVYGLRNPLRFAVRPGTPAPGSIFTSDVGWNTHEELSYAPVGANMGWPCYESFFDAPGYLKETPSIGGCQTLGTPDNPGVLTFPLISGHHSFPNESIPTGFLSQAIVCGVFSPNDNYPVPYRKGLFVGDFIHGWIKVLRVDSENNPIELRDFATGGNGLVDFAIDPLTGDVCVLELLGSRVLRFQSNIGPGDANQNGVVNVDDLLIVINGWGPCQSPTCDGDVNGDGETNVDDLLEVINNWG